MNHKIYKNAAWIIACRIVQSIISMIIGMISARYLGPSNYGLITYAASVVAFVLPIVQLGLKDTVVEEMISHPKQEGKIMGTVLGTTMFSSLVGIIGVTLFVFVAHAGEQETIIVCMLHSVGLFCQMIEMIQYWYQAKLLSKYTSIVSLFAYTTVSAYKIYLLITQKSIYWFSIATALDYLLVALVLLILYRRLGVQKLAFDRELIFPLLQKSKHYILPGMMVTLFSQTDKIMIKWMIGNEANGCYSVAVVCACMSSFVFQAVIDSYRPEIIKCKRAGDENYELNMIRLYSIVIYLSLAQSLVLTLFAKQIIEFLYGQEYMPAVPILRIITWYSAFSYMGAVRNVWILAENNQKSLWIINISGALLNVVGNAILIPVVGGEGAAIASVATQFFTNYILCFIIKPIRPTAGLILKALSPQILFNMLHIREEK